jgi:hypothetical protein
MVCVIDVPRRREIVDVDPCGLCRRLGLREGFVLRVKSGRQPFDLVGLIEDDPDLRFVVDLSPLIEDVHRL